MTPTERAAFEAWIESVGWTPGGENGAEQMAAEWGIAYGREQGYQQALSEMDQAEMADDEDLRGS